jgi:hypothetical protein
MEDYTKYMRLLVAMVSAVGRLIDAGRTLSHFAGFFFLFSLLLLSSSSISFYQLFVLQDTQKEFHC